MIIICPNCGNTISVISSDYTICTICNEYIPVDKNKSEEK